MREVQLKYQGNDYEAGDQEAEDVDEGQYSEEAQQPSEDANQDSDETPLWQEGDMD